MSDATSKLGLPYIFPAQAQKHVTHNEALQRLDAIIHLMISAEQDTPPEFPEDGECYAIGNSPTGIWSSNAGKIAIYQDGLWQFVEPDAGWCAWFTDISALRCHNGSDWVFPPLPVEPSFNLIGVNTTANTTNRLSVSAPATLLNNEGAGHQLKINKAAAIDTASLVFQTGWSGRAEMGIAGSDAFNIKVSPDGLNWHEALTISPEGAVLMPQRPVVRAAFAGGTTLISTTTDLGFDNLYTNQGGFTLGMLVAGGGQQLLIPVSGNYAIFLTVTAAATTAFSVALEKNGVDTLSIVTGASTSGAQVTHSANGINYFSAGDTVQFKFTGSATYNLGYGTTEMLAMLV